LKENGVEPRIYEDIQHLVNEVVWTTVEPFIGQFAEPEDLGFYNAYLRNALGLMSPSEFNRELVALGYNVYGAKEDGRAEVPDLTRFMPEIADAFENYIREEFPQIPGFEDFFNEERMNAIVEEVRDHLLDSPPNMEAILDMIEQLTFTDETKRMIMKDLKEYMNKMIERILEEMGFPRSEIESAAASMAYALGSLSDTEYMKAMGGAFGGSDMGAVDEFLNSTYELPDVQQISFYIFEQVTKYMEENLPSILGDEEAVQ